MPTAYLFIWFTADDDPLLRGKRLVLRRTEREAPDDM